MSLSVLVLSASNLDDHKEKDNLFTVVSLEGQKKRSTKVNDWEKKLTWNVPEGVDLSKSLQVEVYRHVRGSDKIFGSTSIPLKDVINSGEQSHALTSPGEKGEQLNVTIDLEVTYTAPGGSGVKHKLSNQPTDFQVRVHVLEARKLLGNGSINPVVKITCGKEVQHTSTQKGTINPMFDEVFFFNFQEHPDQMFDRVTEFKVFNAKKVISDALIGSFKFDLGLVYKERDHCFIHKWLLLSDPDDPSGEAKGYLKISIQVLGPWDDPKPSPSLTEADQGSVDIESNLLRPSGVRLTPATLAIRIYCAEDLPQMDSAALNRKKQSELVDPYCTVNFSGNKGRTQVVWNNNNPHWYQQINLGVKFPTMSERIMFQLKDKDTMNPDDFIGTCYLHMSQISALGENGFLPTFGPCFINCYGSPREYNHLPDKYDHLNKGLIQGVAYRGRVMVEVGMTLDQLPKAKTEKIDSSRANPFLCKDVKYKLFGAFFSATMYKGYSNCQPTFEVSIGTNLYPHDEAQRSVFYKPKSDVDHYYSLKWEGQPIIQIDSQWEDCCQYRIECLNMILHCIDILKEGLDSVKKMMKYKDYDVNAAKEHLDKVLKSFEIAVSQSLPPLPEKDKHIEPGEAEISTTPFVKKSEKAKKGKAAEKDIGKAKSDSKDTTLTEKVDIEVTELDKHTRKLRIQELEALHTDCKLMPIHQMMVKIEEYVDRLKRMAKIDGHIEHGSCHRDYLEFIRETDNNLSKGLDSVKKTMKSKAKDCDPDTDMIKNQLNELLCTFTGRVSHSLPELQSGADGEEGYNQFDALTREHKVQEWKALHEDCKSMPAQLLLQTIEFIEEFIDRLERIAHEPQNSVPDVIIWMLSDNCKKRVAVKRIPSHELVYSSTRQSGKNCGKLMTIYLTPPTAEKEKESTDLKDRVQLRLLLWLGLKEGNYEEKWKKCLEDARTERHEYYLGAYLYQGRDMYASDRSGLSDPYAIVSFGCYSMCSRVVEQSLCPKWDEAIIFDKSIEVFGDTKSLPPVIVDFFDRDKLGKDEFLGSSVVIPSVCQEPSDRPKLDWIEIVRCNKPAGEVLAAFELSLQELKLPSEPPDAGSVTHKHKPVPKDIAPKLQKKRIEILCWGVRDMKKLQLLPVDSPLVEVECSGENECSQHIKDTKKNPNFPQPVIYFDVELPEDKLYYPPLNIQIFDKRTFSRRSLVGTHVIKSIEEFIVNEGNAPTDSPAQTDSSQSSAGHVAINMAEEMDTNIDDGNNSPTEMAESTEIVETNIEEVVKMRKAKLDEALDSDPDSKDKSDFDWWSKYYYSIGDARRTQKSYVEMGYDHMVIYPGELEAAFNGFTDVAQMFPIYRGKGSKDQAKKSGEPVGYFKGSFKVYTQHTQATGDEGLTPKLKFSNLPSTDPVEVIVRVYVIKGIDLQPRDPDGKSDPYIKIKFGNKTIMDDKDNYIPSNLNPIFGKMFEFPATLPFDHTLTISVMDWDRFSADDLIGETKIDLENRFLSQHRATCGLPESFSKRGPNKWRDCFLPKDILDDWIKAKGLPPAEWDGTTSVTIDKTYKLDDFEADKQQNDPYLSEMSDQRLALHILREKHLVPEHIETRNLYIPMHPGISQGQLHMWVDMFKKSDGVPPPPVDVSPRKPEKYVLRVVVWNTKDVILDERALVSGEKMSDIYVKGWLRGGDDTQKTDVHYRSMNGEGNFNWRFVFPLEYLPTEKVMVVKKKEHFYNLTKSERRLPPILTMQIWDNDLFTPDDFLGTIDINLSAMPLPGKRSRNCSLKQISDKIPQTKRADLFKRKRIGGWWPAITTKKGKPKLTGKLELEFEILTEEEATKLRPAAKGREEPNQNPRLDPPNRPKTSFLWFTSPWNSFKYIIWREHKCKIIWAIIAILCLIPIIAVLL